MRTPSISPPAFPATEATILVVDNHGPVCELIDIILSRVGYQVITATNAEDALRRARKTPKIDLLLNALREPETCAGELAEHFHEMHPAGAILYVSNADAAIPSPAPFEFLAKPFTVTGLRDAVRRSLLARIGCTRREEFSTAA